MDADWVPRRDGYSMYLRPFAFATCETAAVVFRGGGGLLLLAPAGRCAWPGPVLEQPCSATAARGAHPLATRATPQSIRSCCPSPRSQRTRWACTARLGAWCLW